MSKTDLAWVAGFFEGEGSVRINSFTKRNWGALIVSVCNTDKSIIEWFYKNWPGCFKRATGTNGNRKEAWVWVIASKKAEAFLKEIKPHIKRDIVLEKISTALKFQKQKQNCRWIKDKDIYYKRQMRFFLEMKRLNKRGIGL